MAAAKGGGALPQAPQRPDEPLTLAQGIELAFDPLRGAYPAATKHARQAKKYAERAASPSRRGGAQRPSTSGPSSAAGMRTSAAVVSLFSATTVPPPAVDVLLVGHVQVHQRTLAQLAALGAQPQQPLKRPAAFRG